MTELQKLRVSRGLTQPDLGKLAGLSKQAVASYENGVVPSVKVAIRLGHALGAPAGKAFERLFGGPKK